MPKMIQVRNVPDSLHRKLKSRAARQGISLSDFVLREMEHVAETPTIKELTERIANFPRKVQDLAGRNPAAAPRPLTLPGRNSGSGDKLDSTGLTVVQDAVANLDFLSRSVL